MSDILPEPALPARRDRAFAAAGLLLFVANTVAGVLTYGLQIAMARLLPIEEFGLFAALLGIFNLIAIPLTAALVAVTRALSRARGESNVAAISSIPLQAARELTFAIGILVGIGILFTGHIAGLLNAASIAWVLLLWLAIAANAASALGLAVLQGLQRFPGFGALTVANAALRLLVCVVAVAAGLGVGGAVTGFAVAALVGGLIGGTVLRRVARGGRRNLHRSALLTTRHALLLTISNLAFVAMTQFDFILARMFLPAEQASEYAAASVLAKSVLWLPVGIVVALFPMVASEAAARRSSRHLLRQGLLMAAVASGALALVLAIGAGFWMRLLYGPRFDAAASYLTWLSLAYFPLAIVLVVDNHQLALHRARFIVAYTLVAVTEVAALALPGATPERLINVIVVGSLACFAWAVWIVLGQRQADAASPVATPRNDLTRS